jgi:carbon storage regulator
MLVIRRRAGESLMIGDQVELEILEIGHAYVKVGIHAPREIAILRKEIHLTAQQNHAASSAIPLASVDRLRQRFKRADRSEG